MRWLSWRFSVPLWQGLSAVWDAPRMLGPHAAHVTGQVVCMWGSPERCRSGLVDAVSTCSFWLHFLSGVAGNSGAPCPVRDLGWSTESHPLAAVLVMADPAGQHWYQVTQHMGTASVGMQWAPSQHHQPSMPCVIRITCRTCAVAVK